MLINDLLGRFMRAFWADRHPASRRHLQTPVMANSSENIPVRSTPGSAGYDLRSNTTFTIIPGDRKIVGTGAKIAIPYGHVGILSIRSGTSTKLGLDLANGVGVIDSDYRGEIMIPLRNLGDSVVSIDRGDRIAQIIIIPLSPTELVADISLDETHRGSGGFGSTG